MYQMIITIVHQTKPTGLNILKYSVYNPLTNTNTLVDTEEEVNVLTKQIINDILIKNPVKVFTLDNNAVIGETYWDSNSAINITVS